MNVDELYNELKSETTNQTDVSVGSGEVESLVEDLKKTAADLKDKGSIKGHRSTTSTSPDKQRLKDMVLQGAEGDSKYEDLYNEMKNLTLEKTASELADIVVEELERG